MIGHAAIAGLAQVGPAQPVLARPALALLVLAACLTLPDPAAAQGGYESLYDNAPGVGPPPGSGNGTGRRDDDGGLRDDDPEFEEMLDRLDRRSRGERPGAGPRDRRREHPVPGGRDPERDLDRDDRGPLPRRDRDLDEPEDPTFKRTEREDPATGRGGSGDPTFRRAEPELGHRLIAGLWTGTVEEVGKDPYTLRLSLNEDGSGTAAYSDPNCASEVIPIAGRLLEYRETVTMGRGDCADGTVRLRLRRGLLLWTWRDDSGEVRAAATLKRSIKQTSDDPAAAGKDADTNGAGSHAVTGDGVVTAPPAMKEQVAE